MDYKWHYDNLINTRRERIPESGIYYEKHHIVMRSMGGTNDKENIILLTAREHFIAHWLLWRIYRNASTAHAFNSMCRKSNNNKRFIDSSRGYMEAREAHSMEVTKTNLKRVKEFKKSIENYRKLIGPTFSRPRTEEEKARMRFKNSGGKNAIAKKLYQYDTKLNLIKTCVNDFVKNSKPHENSYPSILLSERPNWNLGLFFEHFSWRGKIGRVVRFNSNISEGFKIISDFIITYNPIK